MADYYSLIKKAVARLDPSATCQSRQALYERARSAQVTQLRAISPPLAEAEITREQQALEEAVRTVEAEVAQPVRDVRVPAVSDLVLAADEIGKPIARTDGRSSVGQARTSAKPVLVASTIDMTLPMVVRGGATGRLIRYWRWRALPAGGAASQRVGGR
jgi:hypothetical protein